MNNVKERVAQCFSNVFPKIRPDELPSASTASLAAWIPWLRLLFSPQSPKSLVLISSWKITSD